MPHQSAAETGTEMTLVTVVDSNTNLNTEKASLSVSISSASATGSQSASTLSPTTPIKEEAPTAPFDPRVVYGAGAISRLPAELGRLHLSMPLIVSSPSRIALARRIQDLIPNLDSCILDSALVNVPTKVIDDAVSRISGRDCVISIGGASAMGLAKAVAARKEIPHICIPTTYSGSEMTPLLGDVRRRHKNESRRQRSASGSSSSKKVADLYSKALPSIIIYDKDLTATTSTRISAPDGAKAMAESRCRRSSNDDDTQWAYLHLPGV